MVCKKCPSGQPNSWEVLQEAWGEIASDYFSNTMSKVCKTVISANGGFFDKRTQLLLTLSVTIMPIKLYIFLIETHFMCVFIENKDISKCPLDFEL